MNFVINLLLGMLPEVLFFTFFLIYTKKIKEKKMKLFLLIALAYILCIMISRFKILYYISFIASVYIILKILYRKKTQIIDVFVFCISILYLTISSFLCYLMMTKFTVDSFICYCLSRIFLLIPFIFRNKFNKVYYLYCRMWNRNDKEKRPIKSITLRNVSIIIINLIVFLINFCILVKLSSYN